jgi:hypothetical protein
MTIGHDYLGNSLGARASRLTSLLVPFALVGCGQAVWLAEAPADSGLDFTYITGGTGELYFPEVMGGGVGVLDYDHDGDLDLYFVNGNLELPRVERGGGMQDRLYRQDPGGKFVDVTTSSGLDDMGYGMGMAVGDIDNDGFEDVYVTNLGPDQLYRNRGDGSFENITAAAGIDVPGWSASAAFCDYDRDGWLDLYVTQYVRFDPAVRCTNIASEPEYCGPKSLRHDSDVLLHNDGNGRFKDVSQAAGLTGVRDAGLGVVCADLDSDGWVDFYVANDGDANQLWINRRDGTFADQAIELGVAYNLRGQAEAGMGVLAADVDRDASLDLFVTNQRGETNTLYRRQAEGSVYVDETAASGLGPSSLPYTGFGVVALDLELDGDLDLAIANGRVGRFELLPGAGVPAPWDRLAEPNLLYLNDGTGRFELAPADLCGAFCGQVESSRGLATGDLDGDGDLDLVLGNLESPARVYYNQAPRAGRWLAVRAIDPSLRREAVGAEVIVQAGEQRHLRTIGRASSYLSSITADAHFGLGPVDRVESLEVHWPDGSREAFPATCVDCAIELRKGEGRASGER